MLARIEFTFFYDPANEAEKAEIAEIVYEAGIEMMNRGAQFTRPYGNLVPVIYDRAGGYTATLKRVKNIFDENEYLKSGYIMFLIKLCF